MGPIVLSTTVYNATNDAEHIVTCLCEDSLYSVVDATYENALMAAGIAPKRSMLKVDAIFV